MPIVSVIVPSFNRARLLPRAVASALSQTVTDIEVVIVDDASMDDTVQVVQAMADSRVRYVRLPAHQGEAAATNVGMAHAQGACVAFLDSDDVWYPTKLARQLEALDGSPDTIAVFTDVVEQSPAGRQQRRKLFDPPRAYGVTSGLFRRSVLADVGPLDESLPLCWDDDLGLRLLRRGRTHQIDEILMIRHRSTDATSMSPQAEDLRYAAYQRIYQKHVSFLRQRFGRGYVARQFYGWGVWNLRRGDHSAARRWFWRAAVAAPLQGRNSIKLATACIPWWAAHWRRRRVMAYAMRGESRHG